MSTLTFQEFGAYLRGLRVARGLSLCDAAQAALIGRPPASARTMLRGYERGLRPPLPRTLAALAVVVYDVPVAGLLRRRKAAIAKAEKARACSSHGAPLLASAPSSPPYRALGDALRALRRRARLSLLAASDRTGLPKSSIGRYEQGTNLLREDTLRRLVRPYGISSPHLTKLLDLRRTVAQVALSSGQRKNTPPRCASPRAVAEPPHAVRRPAPAAPFRFYL